jgi:HD-like signal output (HDOD) protein
MLEPLLKQAGELPSLPEVYIRVTELLETESATGQKIGEAVQTDPVLTARILKLINSAYYGLQNPVTSISQAVTLLGRQQVLVGSVLAGVFKDFDTTTFPLRDFWQHCIKTAIIARQLAMQNARVIDHEAFFTAGLLHDIACSLADEQWLEVMESLGMVDLDIDAELEEAYLFNTDLDKL